jgi:hypothetical protein
LMLEHSPDWSHARAFPMPTASPEEPKSQAIDKRGRRIAGQGAEPAVTPGKGGVHGLARAR